MGFIFGLGISVFAWVNPSQSPPLGGGVLQTDDSGLKIVTTTQIITGNFTVNTGNVGIGTTNPNNLLQVVDLINFDNTDFNTFLGYQAGKNVVSEAQYNTFIGYQAGFSSSTAASSTADYNTAIGYQALFNNTTGGANTALGVSALRYNTTGSYNTAIGTAALGSNTTGYQNIAIGYQAGGYIADGTTANSTSTNSVYLGANTKASFSGAINEIVIGYDAVGAGSNSVVLGNDSITRTILKGNVGIGTTTPSAKLHLIHPSRGEIKLLSTSGVGHDFGYNGGIDSFFWFTHTGTSTGHTLFRWDDGISSLDLLYIGNNGNIGIGTMTPSQRLTVVGNIGIQAGANAFIGTLDNYALSLRTNNTDRIFITNAGNVGIGTTAPAQRLDVAGNIRTTGCVVYNGGTLGTCVSDIRLKDNITDLSFNNALVKVLSLQPKQFTLKNDPSQKISGLIAQDVEQIAHELVVTDEKGYKQIKYGDIQWLLIEAIKEQQKEIEDLKKEIEELKKMITR